MGDKQISKSVAMPQDLWDDINLDAKSRPGGPVSRSYVIREACRDFLWKKAGDRVAALCEEGNAEGRLR